MLDAMVPALAAQSAKPKAIPRLGFYYVPNGTYLPNFHPVGVGTNFEFTPVLKPLEPLRKDIVVLSGLANKGAENLSEAAACTRVGAAWLSVSAPRRRKAPTSRRALQLIGMAAAVIGQDTPLNSLQMALDYDFVVGSRENGYSCVYQRTFSWKTPTTPMPMESNPRAVFERMFGEGGTAAERFARMRQDRSILDLAVEDMARLRRRLGVDDRSTVDEYLTAVRDVEQRIQRAERQTQTSAIPAVEQPVGIPDQFDEHARLMLDLNLLAFQADVTRSSRSSSHASSADGRTSWIGVPDGHHSVSHHQLDPEKITKATKINAYHVSLFGYLLEKMKNTRDGDGTLLDNAIMMTARAWATATITRRSTSRPSWPVVAAASSRADGILSTSTTRR